MTATYFAPPPVEHLTRYRWTSLKALRRITDLAAVDFRKLERMARKRERQGAIVRGLVWDCGTWCVLSMWPAYLQQAEPDHSIRRPRAQTTSRQRLWAVNPGLVEFYLDSVTEAYRLARFADKQGKLPVIDLRHERLPA